MGMGTVVVTGASRGIGAATALAVASQGYAVAVNYRQDLAGAKDVVARIRSAGGRAQAVQADITRESEVERLFHASQQHLGPLAGLVNNAGTLEHQSRFETIDLERLQRVFAVNVFGTMLCARRAVRDLSCAHGGPGGAIVNVSSAAARLGAPGEYIDYAASKGAIDTFTVGLAREVGGEGIRVNAVRPGFIATGIHAQGGEPDRLARVAPAIPLGRAGQPEEVAASIAWLLSPQASFVTGALLDVSGGR